MMSGDTLKVSCRRAGYLVATGILSCEHGRGPGKDLSKLFNFLLMLISIFAL
ncbi:hypothetical protein DsansV1_C26g0190381 [Dioscorea sansibarensis]